MFGGHKKDLFGRMDSQELRGAKFSVVTATPTDLFWTYSGD